MESFEIIPSKFGIFRYFLFKFHKTRWNSRSFTTLSDLLKIFYRVFQKIFEGDFTATVPDLFRTFKIDAKRRVKNSFKLIFKPCNDAFKLFQTYPETW